eukprot:scaffold11495_cov132-Isochrysis_galbana.AAC.5
MRPVLKDTSELGRVDVELERVCCLRLWVGAEPHKVSGWVVHNLGIDAVEHGGDRIRSGGGAIEPVPAIVVGR